MYKNTPPSLGWRGELLANEAQHRFLCSFKTFYFRSQQIWSIREEWYHSLFARSAFVGRALNWESNYLGCDITMYSPTARSEVLRRRNRTIIDMLGNVFIQNGARLRLSLQMAKPCKKRISRWPLIMVIPVNYIINSLHSSLFLFIT